MDSEDKLEIIDGVITKLLQSIDPKVYVSYPKVILDFHDDGITITHAEHTDGETNVIEQRFDHEAEKVAFARMLNYLIHIKLMYNKHSDKNIKVGITLTEEEDEEIEKEFRISSESLNNLYSSGYTIIKDLD